MSIHHCESKAYINAPASLVFGFADNRAKTNPKEVNHDQTSKG